MIYTVTSDKVASITGDCTPVFIGSRAPEGWGGVVCEQLAPTPKSVSEFQESKNIGSFTDDYVNIVLKGLRPPEVVQSLHKEVGPGNLYLVAGDEVGSCQCSLVARWLSINGYIAKEYAG